MSAPGLAMLQACMQTHVLSGDNTVLQWVRATNIQEASRRLGIYRHAYRARLLETLRDTFGHTLRYLGDDWFDLLAQAYIETTPSRADNLRWYGLTWPDWLARELAPGSRFGAHEEVAELAALDWALRRAFDAADAEPMTRADAAGLGPHDWETMRLNLHPSVATLTVAHNTLALWRALDEDAEVPEPVRLGGAEQVLIWRKHAQPHFRSLSAQEAVALALVQAGRTFSQLCAALADSHGEAVAVGLAGRFLRTWIDDALLTRN
jgi:hypothetical protein